ncbi:ParA family protein [Spiroplasma endosymbiont of Megaselia nigra]|uniref:ParA family protein n=1 Tax=Spiroplasma endosymbiont of Megaselia nigra TaxID=2478537 RepID=UPI0013156A00|nr:AAA family ATPase [Spiroplasma endosymbiont of Megaselia nigra]
MKMISFSNKKGGVGKTTLCKNVAYKFALENKKVLLIDLDTQATISFAVSNKNIDFNKTLNKVILDLEEIKVKKVIQPTKYKNIDIIVGGEKLRNINLLIKELYNDYQNKKENIAENIYIKNQEIFDSYHYVLIDYPPTVDDFSLDWLLISDLILIPINEGISSFKGILDLINSLKYIANKTERNIPKHNIIFNNIKDNENLEIIESYLKEKNIFNCCFPFRIKSSKSFLSAENELASIWDNQYYWRQKQAYEELIQEIK